MIAIFSWWIILQLFGLAALPLAYRLFRWLPDRGYIFSKALGLLLVSYVLWLGAITGLLPNDQGGIVTAWALVAGLSAWLFFRQQRVSQPGQPALLDFLRQRRALILVTEILFLLAFIAWAGLRAYATEKIMSAGGEKFMEIAFLNAVLQSPRFPPLDPWMSGFSISYYYFGYVMMAIVTRLSGVAATVGFELYDALLFALTAIGAFGVVYNLIPERKPRPGSRVSPLGQPLGYGLLGSFFMVLLSNLEGLLESLRSMGVLSDNLMQWLAVKQLPETVVANSPLPKTYWWWWHASRIIWDSNLAGKSLSYENISEFPFFSFLLGDNHPHVLNLPFVLLALALALNLLRRLVNHPDAAITETLSGTEQQAHSASTPGASAWWNPLAVAFDGDGFQFFMYALCLGALGFLNTWDFPIYLVIVTLAFGLGWYAHTHRLDWDLVRRVGALFGALLAAGIALFIFFYVGFRSQAGGILPYVFPPTRLVSYLIMFGPLVVIVAYFLVVTFVRNLRQHGRPAARQALLAWLVSMLLAAGVFTLVLGSLPLVDIFRQVFLKAADDPAVRDALGGVSLTDAVPLILMYRINDPWLFLFLTGLITLAFSNAIWQARLAGEPSAEHVPADSDAVESTLATGPARVSPSQLFVSRLLFAGFGLTLVVEFIYLRDSFGTRMNTIFKFYYQAWVMLAIASAYAFWWMLHRAGRVVGGVGKYLFLVLAVIAVLAGCVYSVLAPISRTNGFAGPANLDGASVLAQQNPDDWAAIAWLQANATGGSPATYGVPVIVEATHNGSYDYRGRISAFSGFPAVLGWAYHELQWRGTFDEQSVRLQDIATLYTTHDPQEALSLLWKWQVNYVIVGVTEQYYIQDLCTSGERQCNPDSAIRKFETLLVPVFTQGSTTIYQVP